MGISEWSGDKRFHRRPPPDCSSSLRSELLGQGSLKGADTDAIVEEVLEDTDLAKYFDEEFEVSACLVSSMLLVADCLVP